MNIKEYITTVNQKYRAGNATEHTYRGALEQLMQDLLPKLRIVNEPKREKCGAPDYIASRKDGMPVFYIEAKDIGDNDLDGRNVHGHKEQFTRYKQALDYIIFTDYLDFHFYEHGEFVDSVRIAEIKGDKIVAINENEDKFLNLIDHFGNTAIQSITTASRLAKLMAGKARLLENIIEQAMNDEADSYANENLRGQYQAFKDVLIQELKPTDFADIYAQTIAYGMFAARLHDDTPEDFSREEAARLIPKTNPFLRQIFNNLAGNDLDDRIAWVVDDLATVFQATNIQKIMKTYVQDKRHHDPMIHFYEDFLSEYNPKLRKSKGVWYTPQPVVGFIVRAVDEILQKEFGLAEGLADYSIIEKEVAVEQSRDKRTSDGAKHEMRKFHKVQILDPATGTGTFLAEVVNQIYDRYRDNQGIWQQYVEQHLLPRLNGFEILMASYAVAHIKLDMLLSETGYQHQSDKRLHVYLTNSLEESNNEARTLFAQWLSREATEANVIKRDYPVMVMLGNPPYSVSSSNKGEWISKLLEDYKKNLNERNIQPLSDDYIKFIRLAQYYVERNGEGIVAYISNNSFIDGLIHRQMRSELMRVFDEIYILDLHGNSRKKETCPDGSKDENVFDIMQGVSINIFVKKSAKGKEPATIRHFDLYGTREYKYEYLNSHNLQSVEWQQLQPQAPQLFFVPKDFGVQEEYEKGFKIDELFRKYNNGIESGKDEFFFGYAKDEYTAFIKHCFNDKTTCCQNFEFKDTNDFRLLTSFMNASFDDKCIIEVQYRPFDKRYCYYNPSIQRRPAYEIMRHVLQPNIGLLVPRQFVGEFHHILVSEKPTNCNLTGTAKKFGSAPLFPLYLYPEEGSFDTERRPNLDASIWAAINAAVGYDTTPEDIFDYIYGILHSPAYRAKYKEFLKVDFPRIPYPKDADEFEHFRSFGNQLRELHLMHNLPESSVTFPQAGSMVVEQAAFKSSSSVSPESDSGIGRVYINSEQYFENVPEAAWNFYIGGYQPAQKWLKDRKGMTLDFQDVKHYQSIIYVLQQTDRIMQEIDA